MLKLLGERVFIQVVKRNEGLGWPCSHVTGIFERRGDEGTDTHRGMTGWGHRQDGRLHAPEETSPAGTLITRVSGLQNWGK